MADSSLTKGLDTARSQGATGRREGIRTGLWIAFAAFFVALVLLNSQQVEVNWIFGTWSTPLSFLVAISVGAGVILDRGLIMRKKRRHSRALKAAKKS